MQEVDDDLAGVLTWQDAARTLWGEGWHTALAEVGGVALRSVQRWAAIDTCPPAVEDWLLSTAITLPPDHRRTYGAALRAVLNLDRDAALAVIDRLRADIQGERLP